VGSKRDKLKRRVRKTVKWGGAVLTVLLVVVWIGSAWWVVVWTDAGGSYGLQGGQAVFSEPQILLEPGLTFFRVRAIGPRPFAWWFDRSQGFSGRYWHFIPLWPLPLLSLLATAAASRADAKYLRRVRVGLCAKCGYDRAGLVAGAVCPECGGMASERV